MSGRNGMDSTLEYILSDARGFLMSLCARHLRPRVGNFYSFVGSHRACFTRGLGLCLESMREAGGVDGWRNPIYPC
jgi:hypothetical protein